MDTGKFLSLLICLVVLGCFSLYGDTDQTGAIAAAEAENLVINGDFEDANMNLPIHWTKEAWQNEEVYTTYYLESDNPHSGKRYVTIENHQSNDARLVQKVKVKPFTYYRLSAWIKASGCGDKALGANLSVMQQNFMETSADLKDTNGKWEFIEYNVRTGSKQETMDVAIRLGGFGNDNTGKASFDDFKLEEVKDATGIQASDLVKDDELEKTEISSGNVNVIMVVIAVAVLVLIGGTMLYILVLKPLFSKSASAEAQTVLKKKGGAHFTITDIILAGTLTLLYAVVAFVNLGGFKAPQTYWRPESNGEDVVVDFGEAQTVRRIYYVNGLPDSGAPSPQYELDASLDGENWTHVLTFASNQNHWRPFYWFFDATNVKARYMKITVTKPKVWLLEVAFTGEDIKKPFKIKNVYSAHGISPFSKGKITNLFDEQDTFDSMPTHMSGMSPGFDEQYHARTALEHILFHDPYEDTHPPLGKLIMGIGIRIFGMVPFGWRFMGALIGVLMIPIMYAFGKHLFRKTEYAFFCAFLMSVDFQHFTQTRIATIDSYGVFFILLMYYFMYKHYKLSYFETDFKKSLIQLLLCGICVGLGCASKWIAIYAIGGLVVLGAGSLIKKGIEASEMKKKLTSKTLKKEKEEWNRIKTIVDKTPRYILITLLLAVFVFFTIIPAIIYFLSYVPLWFVPEISQSSRNHDIFQWVVESQKGMFEYHKNVTEKHSFSSQWWEWPLLRRPMWYHVPDLLPKGKTMRLFSFGNPAIWWIGTLLTIFTLVFAIGNFLTRFFRHLNNAPPNMKAGAVISSFFRDKKGKDDGRFLLLVGFLFQYGVWIIAPRKLTFIYHYFASVPFIIFATVYCIKYFREHVIEKLKTGADIRSKILSYMSDGTIYAYMLLALALFIMFYPIIAGVYVDTSYVRKFLIWLPNWIFA